MTLCGLVELDGERRLSMAHDRLLNWAMASHLAAVTCERNLSPTELATRMRQVEALQTVSGVRIGGRLGYVLMDLLWLLLGPGRWRPAQVAAFLLDYMRGEGFDPYNQRFFERTLPTLGTRGVGLLRAMVEQGFAGAGGIWHRGATPHR